MFHGKLELRNEGKAGGVAMRYGDTARLGNGVTEKFHAGSLKPADNMIVNIQHGEEVVDDSPSVEFRDDVVEIEFNASEPVRDRIKKGELRFMSIEFNSVKEFFDTTSFTRNIYDAVLNGVALVRNPAYKGTYAELRSDFTKNYGVFL